MGVNPFINGSPYYGVGDPLLIGGWPNPLTMQVGLCSIGAIDFSSAISPQPPIGGGNLGAFNIYNNYNGTIHFIPVNLHWTGTCWSGLTTYYVDSSGAIQQVVSRNTFLYLGTTGYLFADLPDILHMGVGINLFWNGSFYQCGLSIVEYTRFQGRIKNRSGLIYPGTYDYGTVCYAVVRSFINGPPGSGGHPYQQIRSNPSPFDPTPYILPKIIPCETSSPPLLTVYNSSTQVGQQTFPVSIPSLNHFNRFGIYHTTYSFPQLVGWPLYVQSICEVNINTDMRFWEGNYYVSLPDEFDTPDNYLQTGYGPFNIYNEVKMQPAGYSLYVFALGGLPEQEVFQ